MSSRGFNGVRSLLIYFALHGNYTLRVAGIRGLVEQQSTAALRYVIY